MINIEGYTKKLQHYSIENIRKEMRHRNMEKKKIMHHMTIGFSNILTKDIVKQIFDYTQIKIPEERCCHGGRESCGDGVSL